MIKYFFIFFVISALAKAEEANADGDTLLLAIEVFRHGARGPLDVAYDNNYLGAQKEWKDYEVGQLTAVGMRQHNLLGAAIREDYNGKGKIQFPVDSYEPEQFYVRSTDLNRTLQSVASHLLGIFNFTNAKFDLKIKDLSIPQYHDLTYYQDIIAQLGEKALSENHQPFPVHTIPQNNETLLLAFDACPSKKVFMQEIMDSFDYKELEKKLDVTQEFKDKFGYNVTSLFQVHWIVDTFYSNWYDNKRNNEQQKMEEIMFEPNDQDKEFSVKLKKIYDSLLYFTYFKTQTQKQQSCSLFFQHIQTAFKNAINNATSKLTFEFFSAHDSTLMAFMSCLDIASYDCILDKNPNHLNCQGDFPPFASNLIFELYRRTVAGQNDEYIVKIKYNNDYMSLQKVGTILKDEIRYTDFESNILNKFIITNFDKVCYDPTGKTIPIPVAQQQSLVKELLKK